MRLPRVLAHKHRHLGMLEVPRGVAARPTEQLPVHPKLPRLFLGQRIRRVGRSQRRPGRSSVRPTQVIPLTAAAIVKDPVTTVLVSDRRQPLRHLADRRVPVDGLKAPVGTPPQR